MGEYRRGFFIDLSGQRFGRLIVVERVPPPEHAKGGNVWYRVKCDCGTEKLLMGSNIKRMVSCGCYLDELKRVTGVNAISRKHGGAGTITHSSWKSMLDRCRLPSAVGYKNYGGRGIKVCDAWYEFANFIADMGERPSKEYSIDRIDVNGNYEPSNCRWATQAEQSRNKRTSRILEIENIEMSVTGWVECVGIASRRLINNRLAWGWDSKTAVFTPVLEPASRKTHQEIKRKCATFA